MKTKEELVKEMIEVNFYMIDALKNDDKEYILKSKFLLDNLIKIYLKND
jgi:hypothetical protein